ncbi:uncharacterized protein RAG0_00188 [Rhynchosporium agropyri]|uniref:Uncharacterized protein n=1 Tax=Rhynchosporium agropyri TaxID=914238 RepID=A0A1E1JRC6_9HELO|nr:uncharacterized protein RAG0_00188 [Rhynchosporium agropyri]
MGKRPDLQCVWPKDGSRGRGRRGFWGRLDNVLTGKGPDIFLQLRGSRSPIMRDQWQNWDSYSSQLAHNQEEKIRTSRGLKRYDPHTRQYKEWATPNDWSVSGVDGSGVGPHNKGRTRFTKEEVVKMGKLRAANGDIDARTMGPEWNERGPKRFGPEFNDFWQNAHRQSENRCLGLPLLWEGNPLMQASQQNSSDMEDWLRMEGI